MAPLSNLNKTVGFDLKMNEYHPHRFNVSNISAVGWGPCWTRKLRQCTNWKVNLWICELTRASNKENWSIQLIRPTSLSSRPAMLQSCKVAMMQSCKSCNVGGDKKKQLGYTQTDGQRDRWASWAVTIKTANLTQPKFPSTPFFELTRRKLHKIEKFQKGHKCLPKDFLENQKF